MGFVEKLLTAARHNDSLLCVGLDPELSRLPAHLQALPLARAVAQFCREIIEATAPYVCAFKPNLAFFEQLGVDGMRVFQQIVKAVPSEIPVIADAKRGDIGNTAKAYAVSIFDEFGCDAVTVNPYLGYDSVSPFLAYREKGVILLCRTSNPGARDFQDLPVQGPDGQVRPLYEVVAQRIQAWNEAGNCGMVVGATYPEELCRLRTLCPDLPILIPGIGAQGGDLEAAVRAGVDARGEKAIISASRSVLFAGSGPDFAHAATREAQRLRDAINKARRHQ